MFEQLETQNKKFKENPVLKLEQRIMWSSRLVQNWHPSITVVKGSINLFNDNATFQKNVINR
jgi:hypothetical protein